MLRVISNASPLIYAAKIGFLGFIRRLYGNVLVPPAVHDEVVQKGLKKKAPDALVLEAAVSEGWVRVIELKERARSEVKLLLKTPGLSKGEAEVIALARQEHADAIIMDERIGTATAKVWGVKPVGLLGIMVEGMAKGLLDFKELKRWFDKLARTEFRMSYRDYEKALLLAEKVWKASKLR